MNQNFQFLAELSILKVYIQYNFHSELKFKALLKNVFLRNDENLGLGQYANYSQSTDS